MLSYYTTTVHTFVWPSLISREIDFASEWVGEGVVEEGGHTLHFAHKNHTKILDQKSGEGRKLYLNIPHTLIVIIHHSKNKTKQNNATKRQ